MSGEPIPFGVSDAGFIIPQVHTEVGKYSMKKESCCVCREKSGGGRLGCCFRNVCKACYNKGDDPCKMCGLKSRFFMVLEQD